VQTPFAYFVYLAVERQVPSGFNAEGAEVLAEGRRGIWPAGKIQNLGLLPPPSNSRILEIGVGVEHPEFDTTEKRRDTEALLPSSV
jgi:hypothetical protein